jgi:hypothetical protein
MVLAKSSLFLVLAKINPVLGTGNNHPCSWHWQKSSLLFLPVPRTGMIFANTKNRDGFASAKNRDNCCQYQEQG